MLEAEPDASLVYGFRHTMTPERLRQSLAEGTLEADLQSVPVSKNDAFLIPAGTVHAIGAGILLAEIQQSSNLTYRLYDYNRTDAQGNKRPLHIEKAVATVDYQQKPLPEQNRTVEQKDGYTEEGLCACPYFRYPDCTCRQQRQQLQQRFRPRMHLLCCSASPVAEQ